MTELRTARPDDFEPVYERLLADLDPTMPRTHWQRLFRHDWDPDSSDRGRLLLDGTRVVGFVAALRSHQVIAGRRETVCNVATWVVDDAYRPRALSLIMPLLGDPDVTLTNLTPLQSVHDMFRKFGFDVLEDHAHIVLPGAGGRARWRPQIAFDAAAAALPPEEAQVARDHTGLTRQMVLHDDDRACHVMYSIRARRRIPAAWIHHASDPGALRDALRRVHFALMRRHGPLLLFVEGRLAPDGVPGGIRRALPVPRLYRSPRLAPRQLSNAYSEMVLLDL